jgi:hypothetical protein
MSEPAFPPKVAAALNRLTVPPLPGGFADRLAARVEAGDLPAVADRSLPPLPTPRRRFGSGGWRRSARIVGVVSAFGLATATAAASGAFGDPVYVPVVSETLAKADLVPLPQKAEKPKPVAPSAQPKMAAGEAVKAAAPPTGKAAVHDLYQKLRADPEFKALPKRERIARTQAEIRQMLRNGTMTRPELREALGEIRNQQKPQIRAKIDAEVQRRIDNGTLRPEVAEKIKETRAKIDAAAQNRPVPTPEQRAQRREAIRQMPADQQARLRELRQQLRTAPPAEKPAIRRQIREIWQSMGGLPPEKMEYPSEGNPEPVR